MLRGLQSFISTSMWLLLLSLLISGGSGTPVRVDVSSTSLLPDLHAWVIVEPAAYAQALTNNGMARMIERYGNFSCHPQHFMMLQMLGRDASRVVPYSYGCYGSMMSMMGGSMMMAGMRPQPEGCTTEATERSIFLQRETPYAVCGLSFWNNFFGAAGQVALTVSETAESLASFDSSAMLRTNASGVHRDGCLDRYSGRSCSFNVATICVGCTQSNIDCSGASDEFCSSLNRQSCSLIENTCGACEECYLSEEEWAEDDVGDVGSGSGEAGSGSGFDAITGSGGEASSGSGSSGGVSANSACTTGVQGARLQPPRLTTSGDANEIGPFGASGTSLRVKWRVRDCERITKFALRLREQGPWPWRTVYSGHPGGGFPRSEGLFSQRIMATHHHHRRRQVVRR